LPCAITSLQHSYSSCKLRTVSWLPPRIIALHPAPVRTCLLRSRHSFSLSSVKQALTTQAFSASTYQQRHGLPIRNHSLHWLPLCCTAAACPLFAWCAACQTRLLLASGSTSHQHHTCPTCYSLHPPLRCVGLVVRRIHDAFDAWMCGQIYLHRCVSSSAGSRTRAVIREVPYWHFVLATLPLQQNVRRVCLQVLNCDPLLRRRPRRQLKPRRCDFQATVRFSHAAQSATSTVQSANVFRCCQCAVCTAASASRQI
jgi:hypothetical protein